MTESDLQDILKRGHCKVSGEPIKQHGNARPMYGVPDNRKMMERHRAMNKTEAEYGRMLGMEFPGAEIVYEGITLKMANGHKYTPDWVVKTTTGLLLVEVKARGKNGFRLPSYQRAKLAYDQCRTEYPMFFWRWAEKSHGKWEW